MGGQAGGLRKLRRKVTKRDEERAAKRSRGPQAHQMVASARPTDLTKVSHRGGSSAHTTSGAAAAFLVVCKSSRCTVAWPGRTERFAAAGVMVPPMCVPRCAGGNREQRAGGLPAILCQLWRLQVSQSAVAALWARRSGGALPSNTVPAVTHRCVRCACFAPALAPCRKEEVDKIVKRLGGSVAANYLDRVTHILAGGRPWHASQSRAAAASIAAVLFGRSLFSGLPSNLQLVLRQGARTSALTCTRPRTAMCCTSPGCWSASASGRGCRCAPATTCT